MAPPAAPPPSPRRPRRVSLRAFVASFGGFILVSTVVAIVVAYRATSAAALERAYASMAQLAGGAMEKTVDFLGPVEHSVMVTTRHVGPGSSAGDLELILGQALDLEPRLLNLYVGLADGSFVQGINIPPGTDRYGPDHIAIPEGATRIVRVIDRRQSPVREVREYRDPAGVVLATEVREDVDYDPRERPWYGAAVEAGQTVWTDVYPFFTLKTPGVTASAPVRAPGGEVVAVVAADVTLQDLSRYLTRVSSAGDVLVVNDEGQLVAYPEGLIAGGRAAGAEPRRPSEIGRPELEPIIERLHAGEELFHAVAGAEGAEHVICGHRFDAPLDRWMMVVVVPRELMVGPVERIAELTSWFALAGVGLALLTLAVVIQAIVGSIRALASEARRIREFDLEGDVSVRSWLREVHELGESLASMKTAVRSFSRYVPRPIVRRLLASGEGIELGGKSRDLTLFFSDIKGFTGISESLEPEALVTHLAEYFDAVTGVLLEHGATIDKYIGDAVMAFWGAPRACIDGERQACLAALKIQARLDELNERWRAEERPVLETRIGLHHGPVVVGNFGGTERLNYTAVGDAVNVAARLESANKSYRTHICISEAVRSGAGEGLACRPLDIAAVVGRRRGMRIYELLGDTTGLEGVPQADPALVALAERTTEALDLYLSGDFERALTRFEEMTRDYPRDPISRIYVERCRLLVADPPSDSWNAVYRMSSASYGEVPGGTRPGTALDVDSFDDEQPERPGADARPRGG